MANPNAPFGLSPVKSVGHMSVIVNEYLHAVGDNIALFIGDPVSTTGTSSSAVTGIPDGTPIATALGTSTTTAARGAVTGVRPTLTNLTLQYCPALTALGLLVADDPFQIFRVMSNGTVVVGNIGGTAGITSGSGSTITGLSAYVLTESDFGTSTHLLHAIRLSPIVNNVLGANAILDVTINLHELATSSAGT